MNKTKDTSVDLLATALEKTQVSPSGVSFAGQGLKLDTVEDAKPIIDAINACSHLEYLNLEGNTLGVEASKGIAEALEKHPELKRALWKDMFTGRMKNEIPKSLQYLGDGMIKAGVRLTELDLSDNAFGPIGVEGLATLLRSPSCYALEELRLNNNGLGITGGKLLASALTDCYNSSKKEGKALALKVFIAGRNRLENDGAKALAGVFKMIGTLEEIAMPQNGIYHIGISALSDAFSQNKNLQILNLNDNTIGEKGAEAISSALVNIPNLKEINFGDCLLKTKGALSLAKGLKGGHDQLEELILGFNEIKQEGGLELVSAMANKSKLKSLILDGNQFGDKGAKQVAKKMQDLGKLESLGSLEENESEEESEDDSDSEESSSDSDTQSANSEDSESELKITEIIDEETPDIENKQSTPLALTKVTVQEFLKDPTAVNFMHLGNSRDQMILSEAKGTTQQINLDTFIPILMKVSALTEFPKVAESATKLSETLYKELFLWAQKADNLSLVNNSLLVNLGLIKNEDKKYNLSWTMPGCLKALKNVLDMNFVPESTKDTLKVFISREIEKKADHLQLKKDILAVLK